jgi:uncharacterized protein (TIRG00374 family)
MAFAWIAALLLRPVRLMVLLQAMAPQLPARRYGAVWSASIVAMGLNTVVPMRAGDMAMALLLNQGIGIGVPRAFSAMLVDRFFDFTTVIVMFVCALAVAPVAAAWTVGLLPSMSLAVIGLALGLWLLVHLRPFWLAVIGRLLSRLGAARRAAWQARAEELFGGFASIDRLPVLSAVILLSLALWLVIAASYWSGIAAVWPAAPPAAAAFAASAVALSFVVPITPGGVGVFHGACVLALSLFEVPFEPALAFAIVAHAFQVGAVMVLALVTSVIQGISLRSLLDRAQPGNPHGA